MTKKSRNVPRVSSITVYLPEAEIRHLLSSLVG